MIEVRKVCVNLEATILLETRTMQSIGQHRALIRIIIIVKVKTGSEVRIILDFRTISFYR